MLGDSNRQRLFADVVTVDAWHTRFAQGGGIARLHADVVFGTGRIGSEEEARVRFKLRLKRAELVVIAPPTEPLTVIKSSVCRDQPISTGVVRKALSLASAGEAYIGAEAGVSTRGVTASLQAKGSRHQSQTGSTNVEVQREFASIQSVQSQDRAGQYRWILSPGLGLSSLEGRPWDAYDRPRLSIKDLRKVSSHLEPSLRVEVRCYKEDLDIFDLEAKNESVGQIIINSAGFHNRRAAAEAYIREALSKEGLDFRDFDDPYGVISLADIVAREDEGECDN